MTISKISTITKVVGGVGAGALLSLSLTATPALAQTSDVATYRADLVKQAKSDAGAGSVLRQFDGLSSGDKAKFVKYATDPDLLEASMSSPSSAKNGTTQRAYHNGDVSVTTVKTATVRKATSSKRAKGASAGTTYDVNSWWSFSQTILGVTVTKLKQDYYYQTRDGAVVSSTSCIDSHVNYNAAVAISSNTNHLVYGTHGKCITIWTGNIVFKGFGIDMDKEQLLEVDGSGIYDTHLVNV